MELYKYINNNEYLKDYPKLLDAIYYNDFIEYDINEINDKEKNYLQTNLVLEKSDLGFNSNGFRSPEFTDDVEFLVSGCSVTFGIGLPREKIWHEMLLNKIEYSYASVAFEGDSIGGQIQKIFSYINKYGNPKTILMLLPDFNRIKIFNKEDMFVCDQFNHAWGDKHLKNINRSVAHVSDNQSSEKYFKRPLDAEMIIPEEMSHMYSAQYINMLETYCKNTGVNLLYGTWDNGTEYLIEKLKNERYFKNFIKVNMPFWDYDPENNLDSCLGLECHVEYNSDYYYHRASDRQKGNAAAHFGWHRHMHIKEIFAKSLNRRFNYDFKD